MLMPSPLIIQKKCYKTLLAEKQDNMTATRLMNDLFQQTNNSLENSI